VLQPAGDRLAKAAEIKAQIVNRRRPRIVGGALAVIAENKLKQNFNLDAPDTVWVTDITYIKTHEGWLYSHLR